MESVKFDRERGQILVQVALMVVVLFAFVALALDVGHVYAGRRRMQNAADAGALAGAREICFGDSSQAEAKAREYADDRNGSQGADVFQDDITVTVVASQTLDTFFAGVIGIDTAHVRAEAAAVCGSAVSAAGLWPMAFSVAGWEALSGTLDCDEGEFYIWTGSFEGGGGATEAPDCDIYDCDVDGDDHDDFVESLGRAWLDFSGIVEPGFPDPCSQPGCGTSELKCWLENDSGAKVVLPECIPGDTGKKAGVKNSVESRIGRKISIPLYESIDCATGPTCPGSSVEVTDFGCIKVLGWVQNLRLERLDGGNPPWKDHVIKAAISCDSCPTYSGSSVGGGSSLGGVQAVSLVPVPNR